MFVGGDFQGEQYTTVPYSRNEQSANDKQFTETVLVSGNSLWLPADRGCGQGVVSEASFCCVTRR